MKGRAGSSTAGGAPADLLVCFPSRAARLALMPKPICSPSRATDAGKRHHHHPTVRSGARGQASPLFRTKSKNASAEIAEPTSPKITCAGQIKVSRTKPRPGLPGGGGNNNWVSVVEQIEQLHGRQRKRAHWIDLVGLKKDVVHLVSALRGLRFNMRCFGAFHGAVDCSSDEEEGEEYEEGDEEGQQQEEDEGECSTDASRSVFSKWFMLLEENQREGHEMEPEEEAAEIVTSSSSAPPQNALLLMRCRSAPAKGWLKRGGGGDEAEEANARMRKEEAKDEEEEERLVLMSYAPDFFKMSTDIAKETWVVGSADPLTRSRSWRR